MREFPHSIEHMMMCHPTSSKWGFSTKLRTFYNHAELLRMFLSNKAYEDHQPNIMHTKYFTQITAPEEVAPN